VVASIDRGQAYRNISNVEFRGDNTPCSSQPDNASRNLEKAEGLVRSCLKLVHALSLLPGTAPRHWLREEFSWRISVSFTRQLTLKNDHRGRFVFGKFF
jgi:hypothetical protein